MIAPMRGEKCKECRKHPIRIDDDVDPNEKILIELVDEMLEEIDESKLKKDVDEMLRQRCKLGEEHQYHLDQMQNYLKNDIVWESKKERLTLPTQKKKAQVGFSCQRDLNAPPLTLMNQDLFYIKHRNLGQKKYTLSLYMFPIVPFPDDDIE
ncbi:hypothetical protein Tco_1166068 [Tanacetum coccineum]